MEAVFRLMTCALLGAAITSNSRTVTAAATVSFLVYLAVQTTK